MYFREWVVDDLLRCYAGIPDTWRRAAAYRNISWDADLAADHAEYLAEHPELAAEYATYEDLPPSHRDWDGPIQARIRAVREGLDLGFQCAVTAIEGLASLGSAASGDRRQETASAVKPIMLTTMDAHIAAVCEAAGIPEHMIPPLQAGFRDAVEIRVNHAFHITAATQETASD